MAPLQLPPAPSPIPFHFPLIIDLHLQLYRGCTHLLMKRCFSCALSYFLSLLSFLTPSHSCKQEHHPNKHTCWWPLPKARPSLTSVPLEKEQRLVFGAFIERKSTHVSLISTLGVIITRSTESREVRDELERRLRDYDHLLLLPRTYAWVPTPMVSSPQLPVTLALERFEASGLQERLHSHACTHI